MGAFEPRPLRRELVLHPEPAVGDLGGVLLEGLAVAAAGPDPVRDVAAEEHQG
jgi:hypothetical protein